MKVRIYKITFPTNETYVGQTSKHEFSRWGQHMDECERQVHTNPRMQEIYNEYGYDDWKFEVIEVIEHDDKWYINLMESNYIENTPNTINVNRKHASKKKGIKLCQKEYYERTKTERRKKSREYYYKKK